MKLRVRGVVAGGYIWGREGFRRQRGLGNKVMLGSVVILLVTEEWQIARSEA